MRKGIYNLVKYREKVKVMKGIFNLVNYREKMKVRKGIFNLVKYRESESDERYIQFSKI